jgi:hypothetical protein
MSPTQATLSEISPELVLVDPELRSRALLRPPELGALWEVASEPSRPSAVASRQRSERYTPPRDARSRRRGGRLAKTLLLSVAAASLTANAVTIARTWRSAEPAPTVAVTRPAEVLPRLPATVGSAAPKKTPGTQKRAGTSAPAATHRRAQRERPTSTNQRGHALTATAREAGRGIAAPQSHATRPVQQASGTVVTRRTEADRPSLSWHPVKGASYYNLVIWRGHRRVLDVWPNSTHVLLPKSWKYNGVRGSLSPGRYLWFAYPGFGTRASARYGTSVQSGILIVADTKVS